MVVDVQAQINKAWADQQAEFQRHLKEATGHDDFKSLTEARLKEQGKLQEFVETHKAEATTCKSKFEVLAISHTLLTAVNCASGMYGNWWARRKTSKVSVFRT